MFGNPPPGSPDPRREIWLARERVDGPVVRHVAREVPSLAGAADFSVSLGLPVASRSPSIVAQAREVIEFILDDPDPRLVEIRQQLRAWVDAYPGYPDRALLEHLIETCGQTNAHRPPEETAPVIVHRAASR